MKTKIFLISALLFCTFLVIAQQSGNAVYGYSSPIGKQANVEKLFINDTSFIIQSSIGMNVIADHYVAIFGLSAEATSLAECNIIIDKQIQGFTSDLKKLGVSDADIFIDMTTQNIVTDYKISGNMAEEYIKGFELGKNVIINLKSIRDLDKIVIAASKNSVYDLVKVDYIVSDISKVYNELFKAAVETINMKKALYTSATSSKLSPSSEIYGENFYSYLPSQLYKKYTAQSGSEFYGDYDDFTKKDLRLNTTYYYDRMNYSGLDKVINPTVSEPCVEYILTLQIKYRIEQ